MAEAKAPVLIVGGGTIGCGWAAAFAAAGHPTQVFDPAPETAARVELVWRKALPVLERLGNVGADVAPPSHIARLDEAAETVAFVQEALPERLELKRQVLAALERHVPADAVIASSTSGLSPSDIQDALAHPERLVVGHPCNPPYLMPVVEICAGAKTDAPAMDRADAFYSAIGKTVLRLRREMPGHLVNRLQAALWREAVHLAAEGVASVDDIEKAVTKGLAARWCVTGPTAIFHLAGGEAGLAKFFDDLGPEVEKWWASLGTPRLDAETRAALIEGVAQSPGLADAEALAGLRDARVPEILNLLSGTEDRNGSLH
ncbi:3-hydroxyacyl-CoA dehydrogenase NAD-binding domain-containing protein [Nitratireductor pacificus]|uniref:Putative hydroxlacyl-CoA dehydrogenase n=1 Tax=Nitratireductor pacificus pht-3B TaxID=391937 RepID=K2N4R9_9HYPH|nr:3-hydroxyacyl-CoA dehydrogenase NAD-binding domain-containing protein [Nitratireductor pacificus]EKF19173.1 putative hydroxlacyl-CoA dehydrogenase [Nitratireductor pacificus pht-3B]